MKGETRMLPLILRNAVPNLDRLVRWPKGLLQGQIYSPQMLPCVCDVSLPEKEEEEEESCSDAGENRSDSCAVEIQGEHHRNDCGKNQAVNAIGASHHLITDEEDLSAHRSRKQQEARKRQIRQTGEKEQRHETDADGYEVYAGNGTFELVAGVLAAGEVEDLKETGEGKCSGDQIGLRQ